MKLRAIVIVAVLGCGSDDGGGDETSGAASDGGSTTSSSTTTTSSTTTSTETGTTAGEESTGVDGSSEGSSSTGGGAVCDFEELVCDAADMSKQAPIECGFVTLQDDQATWQAAYDCFRNAFLDQMAVKLLWQNEAVDSTNYSAMVAQVGGAYTLLRFEYDDYMGDIMASVRGCSGTTEDPMCMIDVGQMCLQCMNPAEPVPLCE